MAKSNTTTSKNHKTMAKITYKNSSNNSKSSQSSPPTTAPAAAAATSLTPLKIIIFTLLCLLSQTVQIEGRKHSPLFVEEAEDNRRNNRPAGKSQNIFLLLQTFFKCYALE